MSSITFGGLATGLDTDSIVSALMGIERQPLERLERDQEYVKNRLAAFTSFDKKLETLLAKFEKLDTDNEIGSYKATPASEEFFTTSASGSAVPGSYQVEVQALARQQKDVSDAGYASRSEANFTSGTLTINGTDITIENDSLNSLVDKINAANSGDTPTGVSASIINDGSGYRMVLSGEDAATSFTASVAGATTANGYAALSFTNTQPSSLASIVVDGIAITGNSNTFDEAIPGVTLTVAKENSLGESTNLTVEVDKDGAKIQIEEMVSSYNDIVTFLDEQKEAGWGHDSGFRSAKRRLQNLLVTSVSGSGDIQSLSQLGLETQRDGTLTIDSSTLENAITTDLESIEKLLAGEEGVEGISSQFISYLEDITDSVDGLLPSRKESSDREIRRLDRNISNMEARLDKREETLRAQFSALETLISAMNQDSSFLTQQLSQLSSNN